MDWQTDLGQDDDDALEDPDEGTPDPASPAPFALSASAESPPDTSHQSDAAAAQQGSPAAVSKLQSTRSNGKAVPLGEVVAVVGRSNQDIVVSLAEEDQKAMQQRQQTNRSVSCVCDPAPTLAVEPWVFQVLIRGFFGCGGHGLTSQPGLAASENAVCLQHHMGLPYHQHSPHWSLFLSVPELKEQFSLLHLVLLCVPTDRRLPQLCSSQMRCLVSAKHATTIRSIVHGLDAAAGGMLNQTDRRNTDTTLNALLQGMECRVSQTSALHVGKDKS